MRTATITIDSTKVDPEALAELELVLYGSPGVKPRLPMPEEVFRIISGQTVIPDPDDEGTFDVIKDGLIEYSNDPGTYLIIKDSLTEDLPDDPGTYLIKGQA